MILALTNPKGGVGKSTLAVHLAVWLEEQGQRVALVDADVQSSSSVWLREASPTMPVFRLQTPDDILEEVPRRQLEFAYLVIDGPAGLSEVTRTILFVADVTLLPCGPSVLDLRAAQEAIRVVRQAQGIRKGPPRAVLVPNKLQVRYRLSQELLQTARSLEVPVSSGLRLRQAYADAAGQGKVVWQMGPGADAAAREMQTIFEELIRHEQEPRRSMVEALRTVELPPEAIALIKEGVVRPKASALSPAGAPGRPVERVEGEGGAVSEEEKRNQAVEPSVIPRTKPQSWRDADPMPFTGIAAITVRVPAEIPARLLRASTERKLRRMRPWTQQEMVAEAVTQWLKRNGY